MKFLLAGGGTGGHIYPAISIAKELGVRYPGAEFVFVGTDRGLEKELVPKAGYRFILIHSKPFRRRLSFDTLNSGWTAVRGAFDSLSILKKEKPDMVIGTGGYVCGPIVMSAALLGIPTLIHEQNSYPGVTNRLLSRVVKKICVAFQESERFFPKGKTVLTGNPVRPEILKTSRLAAISKLGLDPGKKTLIVFGASQGAASINKAMVEAIPVLSAKSDIQVIFGTGLKNFDGVVKQLEEKGFTLENGRIGSVRVEAYRHDMENCIAAADLAVSRGGATFLAELTARGVPVIVVPLPTASENHQEKNGRAIEGAGAGIVILDRELNGEKLLAVVDGILSQPGRLDEMKKASRKLGKAEALELIVRSIDEVLKHGKGP